MGAVRGPVTPLAPCSAWQRRAAAHLRARANEASVDRACGGRPRPAGAQAGPGRSVSTCVASRYGPQGHRSPRLRCVVLPLSGGCRGTRQYATWLAQLRSGLLAAGPSWIWAAAAACRWPGSGRRRLRRHRGRPERRAGRARPPARACRQVPPRRRHPGQVPALRLRCCGQPRPHPHAARRPAVAARPVGRWLRPGGWLLATTGHRAWTGTEDGWLGGEVPMWWSHADAATYRTWIEQAGLAVVAQEVVPEGDSAHALFGLAAARSAPVMERPASTLPRLPMEACQRSSCHPGPASPIGRAGASSIRYEARSSHRPCHLRAIPSTTLRFATVNHGHS